MYGNCKHRQENDNNKCRVYSSNLFNSVEYCERKQKEKERKKTTSHTQLIHQVADFEVRKVNPMDRSSDN